MAQLIIAAMPSADEPAQCDRVLQVDLPCIQCKYNLRGLGDGSRCPECGTPIAESLRGLLVLADPAWLTRVGAGLDVIWWLGFAILFVVVLLAVGMLMPHPPDPVLFCAAAVLQLSVVLVFVVGVFLSTCRDPGADAKGASRWGYAARVLGVLSMACHVGLSVLLYMGIIGAGAAEADQLCFDLLVAAFPVVWGACLASFLLHLETFAARIPSDRLSRLMGLSALLLGALVLAQCARFLVGFDAVLIWAGLLTMTAVGWVLIAVCRVCIRRALRNHIPSHTLFR
jgi:hypothetical protein